MRKREFYTRKKKAYTIGEVSTGEEHSIKVFIAGESDGRIWDDSEDIGAITSPKGKEALFRSDSDKSVKESLISGFFGMDKNLILKEKLDTFKGSNEGFGDGASHEARGDFVKEDGDLISATFLRINRHVERLRREV